MDRVAVTDLEGGSHDGHAVPGTVDHTRGRGELDSRSPEGPFLQIVIKQGLQPIRIEYHVIVEDGNQVATAFLNADVAPGRVADVVSKWEYLETNISHGAQNVQAPVCRTVVNNDDLPGGERLDEDRVHTALEKLFPVVVHDHNGHRRRHSYRL